MQLSRISTQQHKPSIARIAREAELNYGKGAGNIVRKNYARSLATKPPFGPNSIGAAKAPSPQTPSNKEKLAILKAIMGREDLTPKTTLASLGTNAYDFFTPNREYFNGFVAYEVSLFCGNIAGTTTIGQVMDCMSFPAKRRN